jgi:histidinol-phosphate phosphatase family protein
VKQVVILAGGKGTRLRERLKGLPKPLIDLCGKPLLERQIELLKRCGFTHVLLLVNYESQKIIDFCNSHVNWGIHIDCIVDGVPLGTAGATLAIFDRLEDEFLVVYGDTMLEVDLVRFQAFHYASPDVAATLFLHPNDHPHDSDLVDMDDEGRINTFHPYPHKEGSFYPNLVNAALYIIRRTALEPWRNSTGLLDFAKDIFPAMLERGCLLFGYNSPEYIKDCGTPKRLDKVCADFSSGRVANASLDVKQFGVFLDRDGTINREVSHLSQHEQFELLPRVGEAIKRLNDSTYRTIVITNQPVVARGDCPQSELKIIHNKMETLLGRGGAYLDRIYYCPHHPDKGFQGEVAELKINCDCRKPEIGMIERASKELNIDVSQSWFIGDTTVDILTAHRAGMHSILVETGFAGLDLRHWVTPDFVVPDLPAAVSFILDDYPQLLNMCEKAGEQIREGDFVFIGGLSRSGKSNFASCLKESLKAQGKVAVVLSVDRWLRNSDQRARGVLGRYAVDEIRTLLVDLSKRSQSAELKLPVYDKINEQHVPRAETIPVGCRDVVIVEGTIALSLLDAIPRPNVHAWFVEIDEVERCRRVLREYRLRGLKDEEAESVYQARQEDETPVILATSKLATKRFELELGAAFAQDSQQTQERCA